VQLSDAVDAIRPSVVQIGISQSGGPLSGDATLGTGFLVTTTVVVTAKHVVDAVAAGQTLNVGFAAPSIDSAVMRIRAGFFRSGGNVIAEAPEHDLALIDVERAVQMASQVVWGDQNVQLLPRPARLARGTLREGTAIAISGYPLNEPSLVTTGGVLASSFSHVHEAGRSEERHLGDITANPGNSGGPVYRVADASVVGVCVGGRLAPVTGGEGLHHAAGLTIIVPVAEVLGLLEREGIKPNVPTVLSRSGGRKKRNRGR